MKGLGGQRSTQIAMDDLRIGLSREVGVSKSLGCRVANGLETEEMEATDHWNSPRFSNDGKKMMYMNAARSSAHYSSSSVLVARWPPEGAGQLERRVVVGIVGLPNSVDEFPGLFLPVEQLPSRYQLVKLLIIA